MNKETITQKQGIVIMTIFILGSTLILGAGGEARQDTWIAQLTSMLISIPVFFIYGRLLSILPGMNIYDILIYLFGKVLGRIIALPIIWFSFYLGTLVMRNLTEFITIVSLPETPQFIIAIMLIVLCIWAVKAGIEVIGRWTSIVFPVIILFIILVTILSSPMFNFDNLKPLLYNGFKPVLNTTFSVVSFPFAETIIFTAVLNNLGKKGSVYKVYYWSLLLGGITIILVTVRSIITLGVENISFLYFASYASARLINIGEFLERIELTVSTSFIFAGFIKISICLYAASGGMAKLFSIENYRQIVAPIGLFMALSSGIIFKNTMEMIDWAMKYYKYYALPIEIFLPLIVLIVAEIKVRKSNYSEA